MEESKGSWPMKVTDTRLQGCVVKWAAGVTGVGSEVGARALEHSCWGKAQIRLCGIQVVPCALGLSRFHQHPESMEVERVELPVSSA